MSSTTLVVPSPARPRTRLRAVVTALTLLLTVLFAPGVGLASSHDAFAVTKLTQAQAESMFRAAGITWSSSGGCTNRNNSTCTSFDGLNQATAQGAVTLKHASGCAINITGGTEVGHASGTYSHYNGYKLDMSKYTCLNNYVHNVFAYAGLRGDGYPMWDSAAGNVYTDEGSHWDVLYYNCGGC
ncbi:hypothetical protein [Actinacidiphila rubida]|uniref:Uncharacterized protein n=1 Tax=Actinacidiphila rubida TaxID=310780 RepID=A0A1H8RTS7_9ACTN|nr:hypothetical protein [Actinacidiphila rubida]SEO69871.1 hypothetical protein SAMN05216267_10375 [Actinacidiphila rubida]